MQRTSVQLWLFVMVTLFLVSLACRATRTPPPGPTATLPSTVEGLAAALSDPDSSYHVRFRAAQALGEMGPNAAPAVPALAQALSDPHPDLRYFVARALSQIGPTAAPALPEVIAALRSDNLDQEKSFLIITLGNIGPPAAPAVPLLIEMMSLEKIDFTRADAAEALGKIGEEEALPVLVKTLESDESSHTRWAAAYAIAAFGERARFAAPTLVESLNDEDIYVRGASAYAIAQITGELFPDADRDDGTFRIGDNGEPYIVIAAREWWEEKGQFQDWDSP